MSPATLSTSSLPPSHGLQGLGHQAGKMLIIILMAVVVLLVAGGGAAWFFLSGGDESEEGAESEAAEETVKGPAIYHAFDPAFVVNLSDGDNMRFLQVELQVMTRDEAVPAALTQHEPVIRNDLLLLFGSQDYNELETREGRLNLQTAALNEIVRVLEAEGEPSGVEAVYFTSFVMQ
ncbi:MAG: flagellar basal body-associated FliL family protein [Abyssibacter sp.]|uniref:flagellar basal body-associated FliL family protein n=1 Tax=Abyssibacter sp. TaxID=2320200 RepID=UPI00321B4629